jgi:Uncharacterised protein family UPF0547
MKTCPRCAEKIRAEALVCRHCGHTFTAEEVALERRKVEALRAQYPNSLRGYLYRVEKNRSVSVLGQAGEQIKFPNWRSFWNFAQAAPAAQQAEVSQGVTGGAASFDPNAGEPAPLMHSRQGSDDVGQPRHQQGDLSDKPWYNQPLGIGLLIVLAVAGFVGVTNILHGHSPLSNTGATDPPSPQHHLVTDSPSGVVTVWINERALLTAERIVGGAAGRPVYGAEGLLSRMIACTVPAGTEIEILQASNSSDEVRVLRGAEIGCTGTVRTDFVD